MPDSLPTIPSQPPHQPRRKRRWPRILLWTCVTLFVLLLFAPLVSVLWLQSATKTALPQLDGDVHLAGLSAPVTIRRDAHGVPHISAATEDDLFIAQGYVTAQDRLWQMDASRRSSNGDLAEIMGPALIEHDKTQRVLQMRLTAQRFYSRISADDRRRFDDYARGVNLFIAQCEQSNTLPVEFHLLRYRPEPWSGVDSISIVLSMVQTLDTHIATKLSRGRIAAKLNNPALESDLYPVGSWRDHPPTGVKLDLTQPQGLPPAPRNDEDNEDNTESLATPLAAPFAAQVAAPDVAPAAAAVVAPGRTAVLQPATPSLTGPATNLVAPSFLVAPSLITNLVAPSFPQLHRGKGGNAQSKPRGLVSGHEFTRAETAAKKDGALAPEPPPRNSAAARISTAPLNTPDLLALLGQPTCESCASGSNNWVIAGSHTASGKPLLANDMHLTLREPDTWYMADLSAPGFHAAGVTLPGFPLVIAGHNDHVAWGFTALYGDTQDLYIEKLDGKGNYEDNDGKIHPLIVDPEVIHVRGGKDVLLTVQSTAHGPLLNPVLPVPGPNENDSPTALKWTLYDPTLNKFPLYEMNTATNWAEFSAALAGWSWPTLNLVYSDDQNHIAYHAIGLIPIRPAGIAGVPIPAAPIASVPTADTSSPQAPITGGSSSNQSHEWQGYIPFDQLPNAVDPPSGFLATANSRVTTDKSPYPLTGEWADPYRVERIYKSLDGRDHLNAADMLAVQTDIYSEVDQQMGHRFAYAIDHTPGPEGNGDPRMRQAADLMRSWDGRLTTNSAAASIVDQTRTALWPIILQPKLGNLAGDYNWSEDWFAEEEIVMNAKPAWLPSTYKDWNALLTAAVRNGMKHGKATADVTKWTYGRWHVVGIEHPLAVFLPLIARVAGTGPQPQSGDSTTVKATARDFGPSQRFTMDWSNIDGSTENIVLGESSDPFSPYFRDQWNNWYNGTTFALPFTPSAVAAQTKHTLRLLP